MGQFRKLNDTTFIFTVRKGVTCPDKFKALDLTPWTGLDLNSTKQYGVAELAVLGLERYTPPTPAPVIISFTDYQAEKLADTRSEAQDIITKAYPLWHQSNVALGIYQDNGMKAGIESVIVESNRIEDLIKDATTKAEVDTAYGQIAWPAIGVTP